MNDNTELLEAALKLAEVTKLMRAGEGLPREGIDSAIAEVEKFRPAPKLVEGWVNVYGDKAGQILYETKEQGEAVNDYPTGRQAFVREVTPPDEAKKWSNQGYTIYRGKGAFVGNAKLELDAEAIVTAHNEAMGFGKEGGDE